MIMLDANHAESRPALGGGRPERKQCATPAVAIQTETGQPRHRGITGEKNTGKSPEKSGAIGCFQAPRSLDDGGRSDGATTPGHRPAETARLNLNGLKKSHTKKC